MAATVAMIAVTGIEGDQDPRLDNVVTALPADHDVC
jgi:hypothetical protein